MKTKLVFWSKDLAPMMKHAMAHERKLPYAEKVTKQQGLWLVKDEGIYLMSPTEKRFRNAWANKSLKPEHSTVVYANGYKPTKANRDTLWDKTYSVSPDDFVEFLPLGEGQVTNICKGGSITVWIEGEQLEYAA
jgi:hypothetical protein